MLKYASKKTLSPAFYLHDRLLCSVKVKVALFRAFRTLLYTAHLQHSHRKNNMQRLNVAYKDGMRLLNCEDGGVLVKCM